MKKLIVLLSLIPITTFAQYDYELGYWETGFWKKTLEEHASPNGKFTIYYKNGLIRYTGEFRDSMPYGEWTIYSKNIGKYGVQTPRLITNYNGKHVELEWSGDDTLTTGSYLDGQPNGKWVNYRFSLVKDTVKVNWAYEYEKNELTNYLYNHYNWGTENTFDTIIKTSGKPASLSIQAAEPNSYFSIDISYIKKRLYLNEFNQAFKNHTSKSFNEELDLFQFSILYSAQENRYFSFGFNLSSFNTLATDSINYSFRSGNAIHIKYVKDLIKNKKMEISPFFGFGITSSKLKYEKREFLYSELQPFDDIFSSSANSTSHPKSDPYGHITFTSRQLTLDAGLRISLQIPLGKLRHEGLKLGAEAGYAYSSPNSNWKYKIEDVMDKKETAKFIPNVSASGFYVGFTIGFFGYFKSEEYDY